MSLDANCRKLGLTSLSDMQRETIHAVMNTEDDVVVLSPTGTGKTLAYLLPLTEMMADDTLSAVVVSERVTVNLLAMFDTVNVLTAAAVMCPATSATIVSTRVRTWLLNLVNVFVLISFIAFKID